MINLQIRNLFQIDPHHGLSEQELNSTTLTPENLINQIHSRKVDFYNLEILEDQLQKVQELASKTANIYKNIIILGIGGSALGSTCLKQAFSNPFQTTSPQVHIIDNIDPDFLGALDKSINLKESLFIVITKSGTTPETISQYLFFREKIEKENLSPKEHFIFITDQEKGYLRQISNTENIPALDIPEKIGGRFSVLTSVGLLPATFLGINPQELINGAKNAIENFHLPDPEKNIAFKIALIQYLLYKKGKNINVMMPYLNQLEKFTDWYRQLLAESIGKKHDNNGNIVNIGITPVSALGATDQHSQTQLYNEGPNDKLFIFITTQNYNQTLQIPSLPENNSLSFLNNITFNKLITVEHQGTALAYTENDRPNITLQIDQVTPFTLGELFVTMEAATAFLGEMFNINPYDQPGVELSKEFTKNFLTNN